MYKIDDITITNDQLDGLIKQREEKRKQPSFYTPRINERYFYIDIEGMIHGNNYINAKYEYHILNNNVVGRTQEESKTTRDRNQAMIRVIKKIAQWNNKLGGEKCCQLIITSDKFEFTTDLTQPKEFTIFCEMSRLDLLMVDVITQDFLKDYRSYLGIE